MSDPIPAEASEEEPPSRDSYGAGMGTVLAGTLSSLLDYLEARSDLLRWEAREGKSRLLRQMLLAVLAVWFLLIAYAVGIAALVGWLAQSQQLAWPLSALFVALGHLALATLLFLFLKGSKLSPFFPDSRNELRRDREALRKHARR